MSNQGEHLTKDKAKEDGVPARHVNSSVAATGVPTLGAPFSSFVAAHAVPKPFQSLSKPINKPKMQVGQLNVNQGATVVPQALLTPGSLESPGKPLGGGTTLNLSMANPSSSAVGPSAIVQLTTGTPSIPIGSIMRTVGQAPMFSSHVPKGAAAAATTLTNRAGIPVLRPPSINVPSTSAHTNISAHIGVPRQQIINASIRANTPPSTRSPSPALSSQPPEAHRKTIPVHSSTGNLGPGAGIQIARQLGKPVGDSGITKQILSQPTLPKQIHITQTPGLAANKLIVSHCPASSLTSQLPISALSKPVVAAPTVTLPLMNAQTLVASSSAPFPGNPHHSLASTVSTIPVAKVNPVRQQQPSGITPVVSTGPMGAINLAAGQDLTNPGLVRDPSGINPRPQAQPINTNLFNSQSQRSALTLGVSTAANPVAAHSDSRTDRAQASVIPLFMQPEFFMQCQSVRPPTAITNLQRPNPVVVAAHGQTPALYQNLIPSSSGLVTSSIDLNVRPSTPTEVTSNMTAGPIPLPAAALALSSSNSSVFNPSSPHPGSLTPQHQGTQQGNTPVSTPNASPRPSILRKRINEGNQPVKKPVCALNTMATERQSPRPDSRTDSAPQSNNSSPKTPATPVGNGNGDGESQSSTDTALSSEATTPTQTSTAELKIKHEPCDSLENGFPSVNSIAASLSGSLPNSNEASPRKKPRKQLLHANEELKDQSTTDDDLDKLDDIKEEMIEDKDEFKTEFIDDEGVRWTVERTKPQILLNCYNISWKPRNNHFNRYTEVKPKDEQRPTVNELCNQRGVMQKASGWKLFHMAAQLEDLTELEKSLNNTVHSLQVSVSPHLGTKHGVIEDEIGALHELAQGNIQRCQLITDQLGEAKTAMFKVLDHKQKIVEIINKHVSKRPIKKKERT